MACGSILLSCIDRSNPFDPINVGPAHQEQIQQAQKPALDSLLAQETGLGHLLGGYLVSFQTDSAFDKGKSDSNTALLKRNQSRSSANANVEASNPKQATVDSLKFQALYELMDSLRLYGPYADFETRRTGLHLLGSRISGFMATVNSRNAPLEVYPLAYRDSILSGFVRDSLAFARFQARVDSADIAVADSNGMVRAYNAAQDSANQGIRAFNELVAFKKSIGAKPLITKADSLQATTFVAKAGDNLFLGSGTFGVDLRFTNSGTVDSPIVVRGYPGMATILRAAAFKDGTTGKDTITGSSMILSNRAYIRFEGIVFRHGGVSSIKLESGCHNITFKHCQFDSSNQWGVEVIDSDIEMLDCIVKSNGGGLTIRPNQAAGLHTSLVNNLIAQNRGHGLEAVGIRADITNCTFADNLLEGMRFNQPLQAVTITNTLISGNGGTGIFREPTSLNQDGFSVKECDIWGNRHFDWDLAGMDSTRADALKKANLNVKPEFVDAASFNYALKPGSELQGFENQPLPVIIGYRP